MGDIVVSCTPPCGSITIEPNGALPGEDWEVSGQGSCTDNDGTASISVPNGAAGGSYSINVAYVINGEACGSGSLSVDVPVLNVVFDGVGEDDEVTIGGFVGLNSDDDDANGERDRMQSGAIPGEDDSKLVTLAVSGLNSAGTVTLIVSAGLRVSDAPDFSTTPALSWPANSVPTTPFYVVGITASTTLGQESLTLIYTGPDGPCEDEANVTVYEVFGVEWVEMDSPIGANTNLGGGFNIFPGKQTPPDQDTVNRRKVRARATIHPVIENRQVRFLVFDVDDPSANTPPVDDETILFDNRGTDINGNSINGRGHSPTDEQQATTNAQGQAEVEIEVGMQPGDNYRMVASVLDDYFENLEAVQDDGIKARIRNTSGNGWFVPAKYHSPILTVWRRLHIELDSMGPVVGNDVDTSIVDFVGVGTALTEVTVSGGIDDGSINLDDSPPGNGRFEAGTMTVGIFLPQVTISPLTGNGDDRVVFPSASIAGLPFIARDGQQSGIITGTVTQVTKSGPNFLWSLEVAQQTIDWPDMVGGTLSVGGGGNVAVIAAQPNSLTSTSLRISCNLTDDDMAVLPKLPETGDLVSAYKPAYVLPVFDVGDNNQNVDFRANVVQTDSEVAAVQDWDSRPLNEELFWVAYLLESYQGNEDADGDPNNEDPITLGATAGISGGSLIFLEVLRDRVPSATVKEKDTVVHETGHAVSRSANEPVTDGGSRFTEEYLHLIRKAPKPLP